MRDATIGDEPSQAWAKAHRQISQRIHALTNPPEMPLRESICSDDVKPPFFRGPGTNVMARSFISADCSIGAHTYIGYATTLTRAEVGNFVSIANHCAIGPGEHRTDAISTSSVFYEDAYETLTEAPCRIEHDAWIGEGAIVRRGVTIGLGAVVGANSFVNSDVPPFAIVAGSPARLIRYRFPEPVIAAILASQWWLLPLEEARKKVSELSALRDKMG